MLSHNIKLIDFDHFYREKIHNTIMDSLFAYGLFEDGKINLHKREVKQLFNNFVTYYLIKHKPIDPTIKEVFVIFPDVLRDDSDTGTYAHIQIFEYVDKPALRKCLKTLCRSLGRSHPNLIFLAKRDTLLTNPDLVTQVFYSTHKFTI